MEPPAPAARSMNKLTQFRQKSTLFKSFYPCAIIKTSFLPLSPTPSFFSFLFLKCPTFEKSLMKSPLKSIDVRLEASRNWKTQHGHFQLSQIKLPVAKMYCIRSRYLLFQKLPKFLALSPNLKETKINHKINLVS